MAAGSRCAMLAHERLNYHLLTNTATTTIAASDLCRLLTACGDGPRILGPGKTRIARA